MGRADLPDRSARLRGHGRMPATFPFASVAVDDDLALGLAGLGGDDAEVLLVGQRVAPELPAAARHLERSVFHVNLNHSSAHSKTIPPA